MKLLSSFGVVGTSILLAISYPTAVVAQFIDGYNIVSASGNTNLKTDLTNATNGIGKMLNIKLTTNITNSSQTENSIIVWYFTSEGHFIEAKLNEVVRLGFNKTSTATNPHHSPKQFA